MYKSNKSYKDNPIETEKDKSNSIVLCVFASDINNILQIIIYFLCVWFCHLQYIT